MSMLSENDVGGSFVLSETWGSKRSTGRLLKPHRTCDIDPIDPSTHLCSPKFRNLSSPTGVQLNPSSGSWSTMHFALPPRKTSHPPPYARAAAARNSSDRRRQLYQLCSYVVLGILTIYLIVRYAFSSRHTDAEEIERIPAGTSPVVIVTVFDEENTSPDYVQKIKANREDYASRHGITAPLPVLFSHH
jgi:hypothetical protein